MVQSVKHPYSDISTWHNSNKLVFVVCYIWYYTTSYEQFKLSYGIYSYVDHQYIRLRTLFSEITLVFLELLTSLLLFCRFSSHKHIQKTDVWIWLYVQRRFKTKLGALIHIYNILKIYTKLYDNCPWPKSVEVKVAVCKMLTFFKYLKS